MKKIFASFVVLLFTAVSVQAQTLKSERADTPSVVVIPENAREVPDTTALKVETAPSRRKRRKFEVVVVPAPPPGRTRQDILYSDSLGKDPARRIPR
jgi:hypothetical protein